MCSYFRGGSSCSFSLVAGHPKASKAAVFDIISRDLESGPSASTAEAITIVNECLNSFANLEKYDIHLSHTKSEYDSDLFVSRRLNVSL